MATASLVAITALIFFVSVKRKQKVNNMTLHIYGWFAYLSAAATILTFITGILFFSIGKPFGKINDISSVFQVLFMIPLAIILARTLPARYLTLGLIAAIIGISGMILSTIGQSLLVFGRIDFQGSLKFFPAGGAIGIWLIFVCLLGTGSGLLPPFFTWIGILAGIGYLVTVIGFLRGGQQNMLFYIGALILGISYPIWAFWLGRLLFSGAFAIGAG
jgi:hypothetical protein